MRTTTRSSERALLVSSGLGVLLLLAACAHTPPAEFFVLAPESPQYRAAQTRIFETRDDRELQSASAAVLQDLGFHIDESVRELGFLSASKERSAREYGQHIVRAFVMLLSFFRVGISVDLHQRIAATLVVRPLDATASDPGQARQEVRVTFYRVVWKGSGYSGDQEIPPGEQRMEMIRDPEIYQLFFAKLSKAIFLEAFTL